MKLPTVSGWWWLAWVGVFGVLEAIAIANGWESRDTLTHNILRTIPGWIIYATLGWFLWHFRKAR